MGALENDTAVWKGKRKDAGGKNVLSKETVGRAHAFCERATGALQRVNLVHLAG